MKLEYAGLKPIISEHGISFKDGKEDKFKYLKYAIEILTSINHEHKKNQKYSHQIKDERLKPNEIVDILKKFHPNLEESIKKEIENYKIHLENEIKEVEDSTLSNIEKQTFIANLNLMKDYKIQRATNKIFYFHCVDTIVDTIQKYKIKELDTPFNERFWHILQTLEGELSKEKISSKLELDNTSENIKAKLLINIY